MTLPQLFKFLSFLMVLLGTMSLLLFGHYAVEPGVGLLVLVALFAGLFFWESKVHTPTWAFAWKVASVLVVLYVLGDIVTQPAATAVTRVVKQAANLSIFLQLLKIYNRKAARDYVQMYLISLFQFVSCTTLTTSFGFFFLFALYVVVALWTLSLFHIRSQIERYEAFRSLPGLGQPSASQLFGKAVGSSSSLAPRSILGPAYFATTFVLAMAILVTALGMFFLFPRRQVAGQSERRFQRGRLSTGLSGEIDLERFGRLAQDREIVMQVTLPNASSVPAKVLWRAGALAYFDGATWENGPPGELAPDPVRPRPSRIDPPQSQFYRPEYEGALSHYRWLSRESLADLPNVWEQRITAEPADAMFLVSATSPPLLIESDTAFTQGAMDTFRFAQLPLRAVSYTVLSEFAPPSERAVREAGPVTDAEDPGVRLRTFYLASRPLSPKSLGVLNDQIGIGDYATPYEKIEAIEAYLEKNYIYTLDIARVPETVDPIEYFLVNTKRGHCEYFASAMALMLKAAGIPARIAYGYVTSDANWNRFLGGQYVIRRQDAHTWVEAALVVNGELRWVPFDPSPRRAAEDEPTWFLPRFFRGVSKFFEALGTHWQESVVAFDRRHQNRIAERLETLLGDMRRSASGLVQAASRRIQWVWGQLTRTRVTSVLTPLALACVLTAGGLLIRREILRWVRFRRAYVENRPETQGPSVRFYERLLRLLLLYDIVKPAEQTPREFAAGLQGTPELRPVVARLTDLYYARRFGDTQLTGTQIRWVHEALATLRRELGARPASARKALDTSSRSG
jgi:transglutaminase-like putative cysteine protease